MRLSNYLKTKAQDLAPKALMTLALGVVVWPLLPVAAVYSAAFGPSGGNTPAALAVARAA